MLVGLWGGGGLRALGWKGASGVGVEGTSGVGVEGVSEAVGGRGDVIPTMSA